jgi:large subunit ribosomal protein L18
MDVKSAARTRRHRRVRKKVLGTADRPRLAVYRSSRQIYAQLIDDFAGATLASASTLGGDPDGEPIERAKRTGEELAKKAADAGIKRCVFDRGGFKYHGRVQALAEGAREGGLEF